MKNWKWENYKNWKIENEKMRKIDLVVILDSIWLLIQWGWNLSLRLTSLASISKSSMSENYEFVYLSLFRVAVDISKLLLTRQSFWLSIDPWRESYFRLVRGYLKYELKFCLLPIRWVGEWYLLTLGIPLMIFC